MNILIMGNITKDVYLNLDSRTESFETDQSGVKWLNLSFDASKHHFFDRESTFGGAAVTLEVLSQLGLPAVISGSDLQFQNDEPTSHQPATDYRYILVTDGQPSYFSPTDHHTTPFVTPNTFYDYIYIDRSANLDSSAIHQINSYLDFSKNTKLVMYLHGDTDQPTSQDSHDLLRRADLIFSEQAPHTSSITDQLDPTKIVSLSETVFSYTDIKEHITPSRIDILTHLSFYSIAAATILGSFILGHSVESSLKLARANVENSRLDAVLTLSELQDIVTNTQSSDNLRSIAANLVLYPKGILAADESGGSIHKKFDQLNIADTYDNRRNYRNLLFTAPNLSNYVNGVILFDETARQIADDGQSFTSYLTSKRIIPGIKVDQGLASLQKILPNCAQPEETYTKGLDGLLARLQEYYAMDLRFAKWRAAFEVRFDDSLNLLTPTDEAITENCRLLAAYAAACQAAGLVPIVEPELVYDGNYSIDTSATLTGKILDRLFEALDNQQVDLSACILKTNMVLAGKQFGAPSTASEVGARTADVLKAHVPANLAGVVFLSGGQTPEQTTDNLAAVIGNGPFPWPVTFSFARALQDPALLAWAGDNQNTFAAQTAFEARLAANQKALESRA